MKYVPIYCAQLAVEEWPARWYKKAAHLRHRTGLALAEKQDDQWICLHCRKPVRVVT